MASEPKRHHYVPKFILKNFVAPSSQSVFLFNKSNIKIYNKNIQKAFANFHFNTINGSIELEHFYSEIENKIAPIISKIIEAESIIGLDMNEKKLLLDFFIVQYKRTYLTRKNLQSIGEHANDLLKRPVFDTTEDSIKSISASVLKDLLGIANKIIDNKQFVLIKNLKNNFYISDNALAMHNSKSYGLYGNIGFAVPGIELYYPIASNYVLAILDITRPKLPSQIVANDENIKFFNGLQVGWATKLIACRTNTFNLAKQYILDFPHWSQKSMGEIQIN